MYNPATRLLTVLELLQVHGRLRGAELARRLEVDHRSVRRYVTMLQDLGIPVESERGRHGGYRLRPGFKLPPLLFSNDEALAVALGLLVVRQTGMAAAAPAVEGALAKLSRVLPEAVRDDVASLQEALVMDLPAAPAAPAGETVLAFSTAVRERRRLRVRYRSPREETEREVDPYGMVYRSGRWYAVGWCHLRGDLRVFRLDRVLAAAPTGDRFEPPAGFDPREHLYRSIATMPAPWLAEVLLRTTLDEARQWISPLAGVLEETEDGVLLRATGDSLAHMARYLAWLPWPFQVLGPPELRRELRVLADRLLAGAEPQAAAPATAMGAGSPAPASRR